MRADPRGYQADSKRIPHRFHLILLVSGRHFSCPVHAALLPSSPLPSCWLKSLGGFCFRFSFSTVVPRNAEADPAEEQSSEAALFGIQSSQRCPSCGHRYPQWFVGRPRFATAGIACEDFGSGCLCEGPPHLEQEMFGPTSLGKVRRSLAEVHFERCCMKRWVH